ncbi:CG43107 [Drosophila busckii]|uniref:CG43107 n=1 Tax=Drosophila busckii TaxID=30019 RepID=A0A0M3QUN7_DROBS|nr:CG43107 [Drosophila busckii]
MPFAGLAGMPQMVAMSARRTTRRLLLMKSFELPSTKATIDLESKKCISNIDCSCYASSKKCECWL